MNKTSVLADIRGDGLKPKKRGTSFRAVSWPITALALPVGVLSESSLREMPLVALLAATIVAWGYLLGFLGRHGWLPFPEGDWHPESRLRQLPVRAAH